MDTTERMHCEQQAHEHMAMANRERELAEKARLAGDIIHAERHMLDVALHEKRAEAYAAAARQQELEEDLPEQR